MFNFEDEEGFKGSTNEYLLHPKHRYEFTGLLNFVGI